VCLRTRGACRYRWDRVGLRGARHGTADSRGAGVQDGHVPLRPPERCLRGRQRGPDSYAAACHLLEAGYDTHHGTLAFGGWVWRYDLDRAEDGGTEATLSYDWSAITEEARQAQSFPPFEVDHLIASLPHLADLAQATTRGQGHPDRTH